jgi:hypothetical protein
VQILAQILKCDTFTQDKVDVYISSSASIDVANLEANDLKFTPIAAEIFREKFGQ